MQAFDMLGVDLVLRSTSEIDSEFLSKAEMNNSNWAETTTFLSMAITEDDNLQPPLRQSQIYIH